MKAVITHGTGDASVEEIERPTPDDDEVLLEISQFQLSITEVWMYQGKLSISAALRERIERGDGRAFGHEFCGTVVETGADVAELAVGDRVYGAGKISCGSCPYCTNGWNVLCERSETIGLGEYPGAAAEYLAIPTEPLCVVPDAVSDREAAALQPLADALGRVHDADVYTGDVVAVIGAGVMGNQCGQLAQYFGAAETFAVDIDPEKLRLAERFGMGGIDASETDPVEALRERTDGVGPDVVFSAVGGDQRHATDGDDPIAQGLRAVRKGGTFVQVGIVTAEEMRFDPTTMRKRGVTVVNPTGHRGIHPTGPNNDAGEYAAELVASDRVSIDQFAGIELDGLDAFEELVEITANKAEYDTLGPAQISVR